jgi:hypothetical protein
MGGEWYVCAPICAGAERLVLLAQQERHVKLRETGPASSEPNRIRPGTGQRDPTIALTKSRPNGIIDNDCAAIREGLHRMTGIGRHDCHQARLRNLRIPSVMFRVWK